KKGLAERPELVRVGSEFSTRDILTKELFLIRTVNAGVEAVAPVTRRYEPPSRLGPDQRKALTHVLTSPDRVTGFRGLAGPVKAPLSSSWPACSATKALPPSSAHPLPRLPRR